MSDHDSARDAALEARADEWADRWMQVTKAEEDWAEDRWARKGVL